MNRRELFHSATALAIATVATAVSAADDHHHHGAAGATPNLLALNALGDCIAKGEACLAHCLVLLGNGDTSVAGCAKSVSQTLALCTALQKLTAQQSKYGKGTAKLALDACMECEKECRKHEKKHAECKACADACAECIKQCKALAA